MKIPVLFFAALCLSAHWLTAQVPAPAKPQAQPVTLVGGTVHIGNGQVIEQGFVRFEGGKITAVGPAASANTTGSQVIDTKGQHIYPGLILPNTILGLNEIDALRQANDFAETGNFNPNVRSLIAYNTDSEIIPTIRTNGVLLAQATPRGGTISGTSSIVQLDAWNWEDAAYKTDDGIHVSFPSMYSYSGWWGEPGGWQVNEKRKEQLDELKAFFADAKAYCAIAQPNPLNLKLEAMRGLFDGTKRLYLNASYAKEIIEAIQFAKEFGVKYPVIVGGADAWQVTDILRTQDVPVVLGRTFSLPERSDEPIDQPFRTPAMLQKAGVRFCLSYAGDMEAMGARNLPFSAGYTAAYGLGKEEALAAVTSQAANILGIGDRTGTIEAGKEANIVISKGDLLDIRTHDVTHAFIQGRQIDLETHQKALYRKFKDKYDSEKK